MAVGLEPRRLCKTLKSGRSPFFMSWHKHECLCGEIWNCHIDIISTGDHHHRARCKEFVESYCDDCLLSIARNQDAQTVQSFTEVAADPRREGEFCNCFDAVQSDVRLPRVEFVATSFGAGVQRSMQGSAQARQALRDHRAALQNGGVVMPNKVHIARAVMMGVAIRSLGMYKNLGVWSTKSSLSCCRQTEGSCAWALPTVSNLVLPMCRHQLYKSYGE